MKFTVDFITSRVIQCITIARDKEYYDTHGVSSDIVNEDIDTSPNEVLMEDILSGIRK